MSASVREVLEQEARRTRIADQRQFFQLLRAAGERLREERDDPKRRTAPG